MVKRLPYNVGDPGSIPGLGRSPGEGNGNPLQYSCLKYPMDGGAWQATVHGVAKSRTRLGDFTFTRVIKSTTQKDKRAEDRGERSSQPNIITVNYSTLYS